MLNHKTHWKISSAETLLAKSHSKTPKVARYCRDVLTGQIPAGRLVFLAVERHIDDLQKGHERGLRYDDMAAAKIVEFFERFLCLAEGDNAGKPFLLEPWQQFILANLFGWKSSDGFRRFRTAYIEIAKGNGKSPLAAGIGLYGLIADGENAAEIYSAAVVKDQAKILFRDAENMRDFSPLLKRRVAKHVNNLSVRSTASFFRPISSEKRGLDGKRPHIALIDEVHEHPDPTVVDKMRAGTKGRRQALVFEITNSGYDRETVCFYHHEYSQKVLEGTLANDAWFGFVCHLDACEDCRLTKARTQPEQDCKNCDSWLDEDTWPKANPNLGVSIQKKYLQEQVTEAVAMPAKENIVRRLNFCMWTQADSRAIGAEAWAACSGIASGADPVAVRAQWLQELKGKICFGGRDLASTTDICADVLLFPKQDGLERARVLPFFFCPESAIEQRVVKDRVPFDLWIRQGFIMQTPGNVVDYEFIREHAKKLRLEFDLKQMAYDPWNATQLAVQQQGDGITMVEHRQGFQSMSAPTKALLKMVRGKEFEHGRNPVLTWMADNLTTIGDAAGNLKPVKPENTNSPKKIDGMVALIMAIARAEENPTSGGGPGVFGDCEKCGELCLGKVTSNGEVKFNCGKHGSRAA
jgi:phage terminase large subunit-like protein